MATKLSKAERIMKLWGSIPDGWKKTRIIADKVGCGTPYVRTVARQRKGTGVSQFDIAYRKTEGYRKCKRDYNRKRYHSEPAFREASMQRTRKRRARLKQEARV